MAVTGEYSFKAVGCAAIDGSVGTEMVEVICKMLVLILNLLVPSTSSGLLGPIVDNVSVDECTLSASSISSGVALRVNVGVCV